MQRESEEKSECTSSIETVKWIQNSIYRKLISLTSLIQLVTYLTNCLTNIVSVNYNYRTSYNNMSAT